MPFNLSTILANGYQGLQGIQGVQGIQGIQGRQGIQGVQGIQGIQGISGVTTFSAGSTGLTPSTSTVGAVTLAGTLSGGNGGTGVSNPGRIITLGGDISTANALITNGNFPLTLTTTATTNVTLPTTGTLATLGGTETFNGAKTFSTDATFSSAIKENVFTLSGTDLDPSNGTIQLITLSANRTLTESFVAGESMTLMIDDGTAFTITWPTMTWVNNGKLAPTLATTGYTVVALWKVSTTLYGAVVGNGT